MVANSFKVHYYERYVNHAHSLGGKLAGRNLKSGECFLMADEPKRAQRAADFARLLSRICSVVNSLPQTLQRHPWAPDRAITATG
jgi:hypothetical protein